uniref:Peptidase C1A papain C-terminal domain-containing protein n=1 Tax=Daphnia galeata TaxID=27404 RepID=A0A8J2RV65_9CRUS|nr:unnamed protein product [Daphnia galeata]
MWKLFRLCSHCGRRIFLVYQDRNAGEPQVEQESEDLPGRKWKKRAKHADASNPIIALKSLAKENVVAVCVAVTDKFMSGVYTAPCKGNEGLHAIIAAVGYGTTDKGIKYWTENYRNSWGPRFGYSGNILFQRCINLCGVERDLATVNVA